MKYNSPVANAEIVIARPSKRSLLKPWQKVPGESFSEPVILAGPRNKFLDDVGTVVFNSSSVEDIVKVDILYLGAVKIDRERVTTIELGKKVHRDSEEFELSPNKPVKTIINKKTGVRITIKLVPNNPEGFSQVGAKIKPKPPTLSSSAGAKPPKDK